MPYERKRKPAVGIGITLREYRKEHDLSQEEFGELCGLTGGAISLIESGKRTNFQLDTLLKLSSTIGMTLDEIVAQSTSETATA